MIDEFLLRESGLEPQEVETVVETPVEEFAVETVVGEEVVATEPVVEEPKPVEKKKIEYNKFLEEHDEVFSKYYQEKGTNYKDMSPDKLAELQIRKANPHLSEEDIKDELADKYGVGSTVYSEQDEDYDDPDELKEAKRINKETAKLQRQLKKDAPLFAKEFEDNKQGITLPEFEMDWEAPKAEAVDNEASYTKMAQEQAQQVQEHNEKVWQPLVDKEVNELSEIKFDIEVEVGNNKEVIPLSYKPSDAQKAELKKAMNGYIASEYESSQYVDEKGEADIKRFFTAKAKEQAVDSLIALAVKEATTKVKSEIYKKEFVRYTDEPRDVAPNTYEPEDVETYLLNRRN